MLCDRVGLSNVNDSPTIIHYQFEIFEFCHFSHFFARSDHVRSLFASSFTLYLFLSLFLLISVWFLLLFFWCFFFVLKCLQFRITLHTPSKSEKNTLLVLQLIEHLHFIIISMCIIGNRGPRLPLFFRFFRLFSL